MTAMPDHAPITVTEEMVQRGMAAFDAYQWDISPVDAMRAALEAALAVMPCATNDQLKREVVKLVEIAGDNAYAAAAGFNTTSLNQQREAQWAVVDRCLLSPTVVHVPDDAEFEHQVDLLIDAELMFQKTNMHGPKELINSYDDYRNRMRRTLLAMHAQAGDRKLRELRTWLSERIDDDASAVEDEWSQGVNWTAKSAIREIDAMLGGSHE